MSETAKGAGGAQATRFVWVVTHWDAESETTSVRGVCSTIEAVKAAFHGDPGSPWYQTDENSWQPDCTITNYFAERWALNEVV